MIFYPMPQKDAKAQKTNFHGHPEAYNLVYWFYMFMQYLFDT
jgi:hypothetical protein